MTDFESTVKRLLNENVDAELGPRRPAPRLDLASAATRRGGLRPWLIPLLATAGIAAATVAVVAPVQMLAGRGGQSGELNVGQMGSKSPTGSSTPTSSPSASTTPTRSATPTGTTVRLGGATLHLPTGWVARDYTDYLTSGSHPLDEQAWCLTPADRPASTAPLACPVQFGTITDKAASNEIDSDTEGGYSSDPAYCSHVAGNSVSVQSAEVSFGGRAADFRRFDHRCANGERWRIEQYVVATGPGYILYSQTVDDRISAVMAQLVASATLPSQTSAIRYYDHGYVRSVTPVTGGARIAIDRVVPGTDGPVNDNPKTYDYFMPRSAERGGLQVGELITLFTDGSRVIEAYRF